nr:TetR/AcrR family transcriptional regulator [Bacillus sp. UNC41MFS5]
MALKLIPEKSYVAISFDDFSKQQGVNKASIHYHFEKIEDFGVAVTDKSLAYTFLSWIEGTLQD